MLNDKLFEAIENYFIKKLVNYTHKHLKVWYDDLKQHDRAIEALNYYAAMEGYPDFAKIKQYCVKGTESRKLEPGEDIINYEA